MTQSSQDNDKPSMRLLLGIYSLVLFACLTFWALLILGGIFIVLWML